LFLLAGCGARHETMTSIGWAWPLPPVSQRSPAFTERAKAAADLERLKRAMPWAGETLVGRGSATVPRETDDPVRAALLRRAQAREAARRHLAERLAVLSMPNTGTVQGPTPRLGDPGRVTVEQSGRINDLVAHARVVKEGEAVGGRWEVHVALPLANVARVLLNEPIVDQEPPPTVAVARSADEPSTGTATVADGPSSPEVEVPGAPPSAPGPRQGLVRDSLPPVGEEEYVAAARFDASATPSPPSEPAPESDTGAWDPRTATPETRVEAEQRAERLARLWLGAAVGRRKLEDGEALARQATALASVRQLVQQAIQQAPVRSVVWDDLGRCRVTVALDWAALEKQIKEARTSSPDDERAGSFTMP